MPHPDRLSESEPTRRARISAVNIAAAEWLECLADDLAVQAPSLVRRIAAYRLAAGALRESPLRVEELWSEGRERALTRIDHLTPAIAQVVGELISMKRIVLPTPDRARRHR